MPDEQFLLPVTRYRDKAGNPTCAADFNAGRVCTFYSCYAALETT